MLSFLYTRHLFMLLRGMGGNRIGRNYSCNIVRFFFSSKAGQSCPHSNSSIYKAQSYKKPLPPCLYPPCVPLFLSEEVCMFVFIFTFLFLKCKLKREQYNYPTPCSKLQGVPWSPAPHQVGCERRPWGHAKPGVRLVFLTLLDCSWSFSEFIQACPHSCMWK